MKTEKGIWITKSGEVSAFSADSQKDHDSGDDHNHQHFLWTYQHGGHSDFVSIIIKYVPGTRLLLPFRSESKKIFHPDRPFEVFAEKSGGKK